MSSLLGVPQVEAQVLKSHHSHRQTDSQLGVSHPTCHVGRKDLSMSGTQIRCCYQNHCSVGEGESIHNYCWGGGGSPYITISLGEGESIHNYCSGGKWSPCKTAAGEGGGKLRFCLFVCLFVFAVQI